MPAWVVNLFMGDLDSGQRSAVLRAGLWSFVVLHIMWACGFLPGLQGFALAEDVDVKISAAIDPIKSELRSVDRKVDRVETELLKAKIVTIEEALYSTRKAQCEAIKAENAAAMDFAARKIAELRAAFYGATGREYVMPTCAEVGVQ